MFGDRLRLVGVVGALVGLFVGDRVGLFVGLLVGLRVLVLRRRLLKRRRRVLLRRRIFLRRRIARRRLLLLESTRRSASSSAFSVVAELTSAPAEVATRESKEDAFGGWSREVSDGTAERSAVVDVSDLLSGGNELEASSAGSTTASTATVARARRRVQAIALVLRLVPGASVVGAKMPSVDVAGAICTGRVRVVVAREPRTVNFVRSDSAHVTVKRWSKRGLERSE